MTRDPKKKADQNTRKNAKRLVTGELAARNALWNNRNLEAHALHQRRYRGRKGAFARKLDKEVEPIFIQTDAIMCAGDAHVPFQDHELVQWLCDVGKETGVKQLVLGGDTWDCDNYSRFIRMHNLDLTFQDEIEYVRDFLLQLQGTFKEIYVCRGNHEKRWIALNAGKMNIHNLFALTGVEGLRITGDDHIHVYMGDQDWRLCHPRSYRQIPLSLARDLAAKHRCNVICYHQHIFSQGWDRSGSYHLADGGGLFDEHSLDYQRDTYAGPAIKSGFYLLTDNKMIAYEGR